MKVALITDTHFGSRSDSQPFDAFFRRFFTTFFFPYIDAQGIRTVVHLGDVFDRRKYVNFQTLRSCMEYFWEPLAERNVTVHSILGNHDTFFKNTNKVNSQDLLLRKFENVQMYEHAPAEVILGRTPVLLVPWICDSNAEACANAIIDTKAKVCFGHFEIAGFEMYRGVANDAGLEPDEFNKFDLVCSGHFHHKSTRGNINYLGSPYEMTWSDYDDPRGFHIFDTETLELEFIQNPYTMFQKVLYDDSKPITPASTLAGSCVKLVVINKTDFYAFDKYVDSLYQNNVLELKIIEDFSEFETDALDDDAIDIEDTMTLLEEYVDAIETDTDKDRVKTVLKTLYVEAQHVVTG
jgi:DNA repair exonuclease SbcCD nuclease subunit